MVSERLAPWRAALRMARRDAWRNKGRSALVALMIALPVLVMATTSVVLRSAERDLADEVRVALGTQAQAVVIYRSDRPIAQTPDGVLEDSGRSPGTGIAAAEFERRIAAVVPPRDALVRDRTVMSDQNLRWGDRLLSTELREFDYAADGLEGVIEQMEGRAPERPGEVVVTRDVARTGVRVGDELVYRASETDPERRLRVVGTVRGLDLYRQVIGLPGSMIPERAYQVESFDRYAGGFEAGSRVLVVGPDPVTWDQVLALNQVGASVLSRQVAADPPPAEEVVFDGDPYAEGNGLSSSEMGVAGVLIGMILLQIALLAGPAIAVGARRNQHTLALMASAGADRKHLRTVVLATNGLIGVVSSLLAAALGAGLGAALVPVLRRFGFNLVSTDLKLTDLAVLVLVGGLTAVGAALVPAWQAARLDVVAALTGRRGYHPPKLHIPLLGLLIAAFGTVLALVGADEKWTFITVLGLGVAEVGAVMASGAVVGLAARLAARLPFSIRFALRDAARQRGRTVPAVAAVLAAIAGGSAALVFLASLEDHDRRDYRPRAADGVVLIPADGGYYNDQVLPSVPKAEEIVRSELPVGPVQTYRTAKWQESPDVTISLIELMPPETVCPGESGRVEPEWERMGGQPGPCLGRAPAGQIEFEAGALFDDGSVLEVLTGGRAPADVAALRAGSVVTTHPELIWPDGMMRVSVERDSTEGETIESTTVSLKAVLAEPGQQSVSGAVYPLSVAGKLNVPLEDSGLIAATTRMPSEDEQERVTELVKEEAGLEVHLERGYEGSEAALAILVLVTAAGVISLVGTFTAVGLAAAETRADVSTLAAVGAGPGVRRRLAAAQAGVIAGLGSGLGVLSGILAGYVLVRAQSDWLMEFGAANLWRFVLPWPELLGVLVGFPLLAMAIGFLTTRSRLSIVRRIGQ